MKSDSELLSEERAESARLCVDNSLLRDSWCKLQQDYQKSKNDLESLTDKLHAYEKQWTDMDYTIGHLRQENAELKAEVVEERAKLDHALTVNEEGTLQWWIQKHDKLATELAKCLVKLLDHKAALEKCREAFEIARGRIAGGYTIPEVEDSIKTINQLAAESPNPQPTQDPATAISRLYPGSARPVNPQSK